MNQAMVRGRRWVAATVLVTVLLLGMAAPARAAKLEIVFKDGLWGVGIGALIGLAQVVSYKKPDNEYYRIPQDAAIGAIFGVAFGFAEAAGAFASYDAGRDQLALGLPALQVTRTEHGTRVMAPLFEARF